jgi:hypothetical protein
MFKLVIFYVALSINMDLEIMKMHPLSPTKLSFLIRKGSDDGV